MNDKDIMELYINRDENAVKETIFVYRQICYGVAYNILHNKEDVEECLNDVWVALWNQVHITRPEQFKAYVIRTVRNRAINIAKRNGKYKEVPLENVNESELSATKIQKVENNEMKSLINDFLETLSVRERTIFVRRYFYVEDTACIAKSHNITEKNVLMILSRVRSKLRTYLSEREYI